MSCHVCKIKDKEIALLETNVDNLEKQLKKVIDFAKKVIAEKKQLAEELKRLKTTKKPRKTLSKEERMVQLLEKYQILVALQDNDKENEKKCVSNDSKLVEDYLVASASRKSKCLLSFVYGIGKRLHEKTVEEFKDFIDAVVTKHDQYIDKKEFAKKVSSRKKDLRKYLYFFKIVNYFEMVEKWQNVDIFLAIEFHVSHLLKLIEVDTEENERSKILKTVSGSTNKETSNPKGISTLERALAKLVEEETKKDEA
jgi:hypothetical protein